MSGYEANQKAYYLEEINRTIPGKPQDAAAVELALNGPGPGSSGYAVDSDWMPSVRGSHLFSDFGVGASPALSRDAACRAIRDPSQMRADPAARTGCGWYYRPNASTPSTAAYGSRRGPMSPFLDAGGAGQWIWDPEDAAAKESTKQTSRVASCPDLAFAQYPNMGWCTSTNRAIVTDGQGGPRFPRVSGGDCPDGQIITNAASCPPPPTREDGTPIGSGYSISNQCTPMPSGALTPGCLKALSTQVCSPAGLLAQSLSGSDYAAQNQQFVATNRVLIDRGFTLPAGVLNDGKVSTASALSAFNGLKQMADTPDGSRGAAAASSMCYGTPFNPCGYNGSDVGPFDGVCITQEALRQGYSPQAAILPPRTDSAYWAPYRTWSDVQRHLADVKGHADHQDANPSSGAYSSAINNVYGLGVIFPKQGCNLTGVEIYRYLWFPSGGDISLFPQQGAQTAFLGRYTFSEGIPADMKPSEFSTEAHRLVTVFVPRDAGNYQFMCRTAGYVRMSVNGRPILDIANSQGGAVSAIIPLIAGQEYTLTWDYFKVGTWVFNCMMSYNGGAWGSLSNLYLPTDKRTALFELAFNKMGPQPATGAWRAIRDTNQLFSNLQMNAAIGDLAGRRCMIVGDGQGVNNWFKYSQGLRLNAFKSFTMMVYVSNARQPQGVTAGFFNVYNTKSANTQGLPRMGAQPDSNRYDNRKDDFMFTTNNTRIYMYGRSAANTAVEQMAGRNGATSPALPAGQWFHFAWVWDDGFGGFTMYINGTVAQKSSLAAYPATLIMEQIRIGCDMTDDGARWNGGMAWFRGFDYRLTPELIQRDMADGWADLD